MLGADAEQHILARMRLIARRARRWHIQCNALRQMQAQRARSLFQPCRNEIHRRAADEAGHEFRRRMVIQFLRRADLLNDAVIHHHHAVCQGHGFHLVMGHIDRGGIHRLMHLLDFGAHLHAELGIKVGKRFVEQEHFGVAHNGAAHRHALTLPTGKRLGLAFEQRRNVQNARGFLHAAINFRLGEFPQHQAEGHIVVHAHMRIKRVILEHHGNVTVARRDVIHHRTANGDIA